SSAASCVSEELIPCHRDFRTLKPKGLRLPLPFRRDSVFHGDLHSFPTRRSSDLVPSMFCTASSGTDNSPLLFALARKRTWTPSPDRKSTRLNSSHVEIAYAVFCLKKKR